MRSIASIILTLIIFPFLVLQHVPFCYFTPVIYPLIWLIFLYLAIKKTFKKIWQENFFELYLSLISSLFIVFLYGHLLNNCHLIKDISIGGFFIHRGSPLPFKGLISHSYPGSAAFPYIYWPNNYVPYLKYNVLYLTNFFIDWLIYFSLFYLTLTVIKKIKK